MCRIVLTRIEWSPADWWLSLTVQSACAAAAHLARPSWQHCFSITTYLHCNCPEWDIPANPAAAIKLYLKLATSHIPNCFANSLLDFFLCFGCDNSYCVVWFGWWVMLDGRVAGNKNPGRQGQLMCGSGAGRPPAPQSPDCSSHWWKTLEKETVWYVDSSLCWTIDFLPKRDAKLLL